MVEDDCYSMNDQLAASLGRSARKPGEPDGVAALRAEIADLRNELEIMHSRVAYLESKGRR